MQQSLLIEQKNIHGLMIVNDNWKLSTEEDRYFDLTAYGSNFVTEGSGMFLRVRNYPFLG